MPRRHFLEHLAAVLKQAPTANNEGIRRGEDDGSLIIPYRPPAGSAYTETIEITALIPELADYPSSHQTYLYTTSAIPEYMTAALDTVEKDSVPISQLIRNLITTFNRAAGQTSNTPNPEILIEPKGKQAMQITEKAVVPTDDDMSSDGGFDMDGNDSDLNWSEESEIEVDDIEERDMVALGLSKRPDVLPRFIQDLRAAKAAGYRVGVLGETDGAAVSFVSLSIKIAKLGISDEVCSAWKLEKHEYLILLIRYGNYYQEIDELIKHSYHGRQAVQFSVGTSNYYKPTLTEANCAFSKSKNSDNPKTEKTEEGGFKGFFISTPLNELLNSRLIELVKHRIDYRFQWNGAEKFLADYQGRSPPQNAPIEYQVPEAEKITSPLVSADALDDEAYNTNNISFPLVAMQFTLRHLVRCTEFCLVCHSKVHTEFEALKPYVCSNPLCLYQYMSLGFGPSIEYEILSQPLVVDLLICFCYTAARSYTLEEFPTGMNLRIPPVNFKYEAKLIASPQYQLLDISMIKPPLQVGDWLQIQSPARTLSQHCRVEEVVSGKAFLSPPIKDIQPKAPSTAFPCKDIEDSSEPQTVVFSRYDINFDELEKGRKRDAIVKMLDTLPSVEQMKSWLEERTRMGEEVTLKNWRERISPAAWGILRWIIASNRSCIIAAKNENEKKGGVQNSYDERVWGMGQWTQFRFAMGAPDKEQRFVSNVKAYLENSPSGSPEPTIFAFHGSSLDNWHSIIREGLHFKKATNGRAYGNGCYHSLSLATSLQYCKASAAGSGIGSTWRQSNLNATHAVSLNEIINVPHQFVSKTPHLVIDQLDWIQTRYLFVYSPTLNKNPRQNDTLKPPRSFLKQDPNWVPVNDRGEKLIIPTGATTSRGVSAPEKPQPASSGLLSRIVSRQKAKKDAGDGYDSDDSMVTEDEDRELLADEQEKVSKSQQLISKLFKKGNPSDFRPDALNLKGIQMLPPPTYASSMATKRLQAELKALLKLQENTPLHELGWYINPNIITNMYQWVFEFHSFDEALPLAQDMKASAITSVVLEARFGSNFPMSPPFIRVIRPRFLPFHLGGGGHVTQGGALCMELLTNNGWSAVSSMESVFLQVRMAMTSQEPKPARLNPGSGRNTPYETNQAKLAFERAVKLHGWQMPADFYSIN
ncbi:hypothetical protein DFH27DRAFT_97404 [Peziza echinospora]|nr:hypothetical protein DFH27DRAFT_97404 [Peziza echinospora]